MSDYIRVQGRNAYIDLSALTHDQSAAITELTNDLLIRGTEKDEDGDDVPVQVRRTKIKLGGKLQALEMLAKYRKLLTDKVEHTDADGDNVRVLWIGEKKMSSNKDLPLRSRQAIAEPRFRNRNRAVDPHGKGGKQV
jgi:hypothetical protein